MRNTGLSEFADRFAAVAADSDYSRDARLRGIDGNYDIRAAADALWTRTVRSGADLDLGLITESSVIEALLSLKKRYDDENELVSVEFEEFWDACDQQKLSPSTKASVSADLVRDFLSRKRKEGFTVVDNAYGIWLFEFPAVRS